MVLAPGWITGTSWPAETVVALNSVSVQSSSYVQGNIAVITRGNGSFLSAGAELSLSTNAEVTGNVAADTIDMQVAAHVLGNASYNALNGTGTVDGTHTAPLITPLALTVVAASNFNAGSTNLDISAGATSSRNAGSYNVITLRAGASNDKTLLRLNSGTYNVGDLVMGDHSRIECKGTCEIRVKRRVSTGSYCYIGPATSKASYTMGTVRLFVEGTNGTVTPLGTPAAAAFGTRTELRALTFVPNGTLSLGQSLTGVGKFIGKDVNIGVDAELMSGSASQRALTTGYVVGPTWPKEVITAWNSIDLLSGTTLTGDVAVIQNGSSFLSTSEAVLASGAQVTGNLRADKVELKSGSAVTGTVSYNAIVKAGSTGAQAMPLALPLDVRVPVFPVVTPGSSSVSVASGAERILAAGRYRNLTLSAGTSTDPTKLTLTGGIYEFRYFTLNAYSSVVCTAACEIRVRYYITTGDRASIAPAAGLDVSKVQVFVYHANSRPTSTPFATSFGTNNRIEAFMFVPRGTLEAKSGTTLKGRFIAHDVRLGSSSTTTQAGITVLPPAIQAHPLDVAVTQGQSATFSVSATGSDVTFQWARNGTDISGATGGSYTLPSTLLADSGASFTVTVSNSVGSITSSPGILTVNWCDAATYVPVPTSCGIGACGRTGLRSCVAGSVIDSCVAGNPQASDATCDGVDNDCNGQTDEDYTPVPTTCSVGACASSGITSCVMGAVQDSCVSLVAAPNDATCDGRDDDCNGQIDEDFVAYATSCGQGVCARTGTVTCQAGAAVDSCDAPEPSIEDDDDTSCNGLDDDCDGEADDDYVSAPTSCGKGICAATGEVDCVNGAVVNTCTPGPAAANDSLCNSLDDDCNGQVDEDFTPTATSCGVGACARTGQTTCAAGVPGNTCHPGTPAVSDTTCNNVDDNCNGTKDEGYVSVATSCGVGGCARNGMSSCVSGSVRSNCSPATPAANDAVCNNVDDDCNGQVDEDFVATATSCGLGACARTGTTSCAGGSVQSSCVAGTPASSDATCNNVDEDCNGQKDEDYVAAATSCGSGACMSSGATSCVSGAVQNSCVVPVDDADHDGSADCADACPNDADNDVDADGVCGDLDNCPTLANATQTDTDSDGEGDACDWPMMVAVSTGLEHSCALLHDGTLRCWGSNASGQLGTGSLTSFNTPAAVASIENATEVSAGSAHSCALLADDSVRCWGNNAHGELGNGSTADATSPTSVSGLADAVQLSAGASHTCAVRATGQVACWGDNTHGQLGNGTLVASGSPVVVSNLTDAIQVSAGSTHTCALRSNGQVACWGANWYGQLGDGTIVDATVATTPSGLTDALQVSVGELHSCALRSTGNVVCWGANWNAQLGTGSLTDALVPSTVSGLSTAQQLDVGKLHSCARVASGEVRCWGYNAYGQIGNGGFEDVLTQTTVAGLSSVVQISAGDEHTCAVRSDGEVRCWGDGTKGQLGRGQAEISKTPTAVSGLTDAAKVVAGSYHSCAIRAGGAVACWGLGGDGQLGNGNGFGATVPSAVQQITDATAMAASVGHTCVLRATGEVRCFGQGDDGQLGNGSRAAALSPVVVSGLSAAVSIATGVSHSCAARSTGDVLCWGEGGNGQLGNASTSDSLTPVAVAGLSSVSSVAAGVAHTCALRSDGEVRCWGYGGEGQLGNGSLTDAASPVTVIGISDAIAISAGGFHTCALRTTGQISCWGRNVQGGLGNGTLTKQASPVMVSSITTATAITAGLDHTCARLANSEVRCWGLNGDGQLGEGTLTSSTSPVTVSGLVDAIALGAGSNHTCAIRSGGAVTCWGNGSIGQLGNGYPWSNVPVAVQWPPPAN
jgi:alpha-tubulin suppressor-like RCC1 family protein